MVYAVPCHGACNTCCIHKQTKGKLFFLIKLAFTSAGPVMCELFFFPIILGLLMYTFNMGHIPSMICQLVSLPQLHMSLVEIRVRNWSVIFLKIYRTFCRLLIAIPLKMYSKISQPKWILVGQMLKLVRK